MSTHTIDATSSAQRVFRCVQAAGSMRPDQIAERTELSAATVSRAVRVLISCDLLNPRADLVPQGQRGRPSVPVQADRTVHGVIGVHVRRADVTVGLADLTGHLLDQLVLDSFLGAEQVPVPADDVVAGIEHAIMEMVRAQPSRRIIAVGLTAAWRELGLDMEAIGAAVSEVTGLPAKALEHVVASGLAEHAMGAQGALGRHVYFYARDTIGFSAVKELTTGQISTQSGFLTHFPVGTRYQCSCGKTGCLGVSASDRMIAVRAYEDGIIAEPRIERLYKAAADGEKAALGILHERAVLLGKAAAFTHDMLLPDRTTLIGEAISLNPATRDVVLESLVAASTLPRVDERVRFGYFGAELIPAAAINTGLRVVLDDPLGAVDGRPTTSK